MTFDFKTDKGKVRELNEDALAYGYTKEGYFSVAVADGMGGHNCGEIASDIATRITIDYLKNCNLNHENATAELISAIHKANKQIIQESNKSEDKDGMGTTIVLMSIVEKTLYYAHCGDSRAYLFRKNELKQLTQDHSYIAELIKIGFLTTEEAKNHPSKHVITKALGTMDGAEPESGSIDLIENDIILICTDGLSNMLSQEVITDILSGGTCPKELTNKLMSTALGKGGTDNITVFVVRV